MNTFDYFAGAKKSGKEMKINSYEFKIRGKNRPQNDFNRDSLKFAIHNLHTRNTIEFDLFPKGRWWGKRQYLGLFSKDVHIFAKRILFCSAILTDEDAYYNFKIKHYLR